MHLDAVIRIFAGRAPERQRHPHRRDYFAHGEISRRGFDMLRVGGTATMIDIARKAMEDKGLSFEDRRLRTEFCRRITMEQVQRIGEGRG
jgi:hypothetical protein